MLGNSNVCPSIAVKDIEEAKKFYGEVLGLEKTSETPGGTFYRSGDSGVFVYPSGYAGTNKATYASWNVEDVEGTVTDLKAKGVAFEQYDNIPGATRDGDIHKIGGQSVAWFKDPDGNILSLTDMTR